MKDLREADIGAVYLGSAASAFKLANADGQTLGQVRSSGIYLRENGGVGVIQQVDSPEHLYDHPVNKFVAGFIGSPQMNFIDVKVNEENGRIVLTVNNEELIPPVPVGKMLKDRGYA